MKKFLIFCIFIIFSTSLWVSDAWIDHHYNIYDLSFKEIVYQRVPPHEIYMRTLLIITPTMIALLSLSIIHNSKKKEEKLLHNLVDKYTTIFESDPRYINLVDKNGIIIESNNVSEELLGYSREELIGQHFSKIIHPEFVEKAEKEMSVLTQCHDVDRFSRYRMIKKNGRIVDVNATTVFVPDEEGKFLHTICFISDMTEQLKYENNLQQVLDELQRSNQELEQFAYVASHDLQEPLRVVSSYCQLLREKCNSYEEKDDEIVKWLDYTIDATERMKILVKELLDFSRVGRKDKPFEKVEIGEILEEIKNDLELLISENHADIILSDNLPRINCIRFRIKQLFKNLISNAIKFRSKEPPVVDISFCESDKEWLFCVKDNGIGIAPKYFDRIFGLFKRLYSRDEYPGTGIGLALCKKIVETHGGTIWVDSAPNKGSSFYFTLPKLGKRKKEKDK